MNIKMKLASPAYYQSKDTSSIMKDLLIGVSVIALYSVIFQLFINGITAGLYALCIYVAAVLTSVLTEIVWGKIHNQDIKTVLETSFPLITPIIYALTLPATTPLYVVIVGAFFASFIGKLVYGGLGCNIFNPALVGRVIVHLSFASSVTPERIVDGVTTATPVAHLASQHWFYRTSSYHLLDLIKGTFGGAMVETCLIPVVIVGILLAVREVYDTRITFSYLLSVALISLTCGFMMDVNAIHFTFLQLGLGGLMFGAFFMATDPVTSPTSPFGKIIYGVCLGFLTMLIRLKANYPEGVMFSILIMNMLVPFIESFTVGQTDDNNVKKLIFVVIMVFIFMIVMGSIASLLEPVEAIKAGVLL